MNEEQPMPTWHQVKAMAWSFTRVFLITVATLWVRHGGPMDALKLHQLERWCQVGLQAAVSMVILNYLGPWEKRYGKRRSGRHRAA